MSRGNEPDGGGKDLLSRMKDPTDRRRFLKVAGGGLGAAAIAAACEERVLVTQTEIDQETLPPETLPPETVPPPDIVLDLDADTGSAQVAALNFAFLLEQLEAAFYAQVTAASPNAFSGRESEIFTEIYAHELTHAKFLNAVLSERDLRTIPNLLDPANAETAQAVLDFSNIDFSDRSEVLRLAIALEDTGVGAYNGAASALVTAPANPPQLDLLVLTVAGKIVSVEARHAATLRDVSNPLSRAFAGDDIIGERGLGLAFPPTVVVDRASFFLSDRLVLQAPFFPDGSIRANRVPGGLMSIPGLSQQEG